jgi:hypothetical protein
MIARVISMINQVILDNRKANEYLKDLQIASVYGKTEVERNGHTPRIVWTFGKDKFDVTSHIGANPHQGNSMESEINCHIFAKSPDDAYNIANDVVVATRVVVHAPGLLSASGEMMDPGEVAQNGYGYLLSMTVSLTVLDPGLPYINLQGFNMTPTLTFYDIQPS